MNFYNIILMIVSSQNQLINTNLEQVHNNNFFEIFGELSGFINKENSVSKEDLDNLFCKVMSISQTTSLNLMPTFYSALLFVSSILIHELKEEKAEKLLDFIINKYNLDIDKFSNDILFLRELTGLKAKIQLFE
ncbi:MAG: hypothetical protein K9W46_00595 [Candidatus Heimdallarchaeum endolithica]|uniref:Uncharacterized protein n=1 Tax=Candidatus Heimdallarchaeum endolithica TaxID=2876572 RepID=A0A9Y1BRM3_9ARCH|nr:MAG: hypothetical protein K9W46_00595 [Candidatus Heimdallarchaeum endolithica]